MNLVHPLIWKEWREARSILLVALGIFIGLPFIGAIEQVVQARRFEFTTTPWVLFLGGLFAIITGVGVIIPDITRRFEFIRSQPIPVVQWVFIKWLTGLLLIELTLVAAVVLQIATESSNRAFQVFFSPQMMLAMLPWIWLAVYSVAFAAACLIRRTSLATITGIIVLLMILFVPPIVPGLTSLSLGQIAYDLDPHIRLEHSYANYSLMALTMLAIGGTGLLLSIIAVKRDWQITSSRKTIIWAIGILAISVPAFATLQLGTNMPVVQTFELMPKETANRVVTNGNQFLLITTQWGAAPNQPAHKFARRIAVGPQIELGPPMESPLNTYRMVLSPDGTVLYVFYSQGVPNPKADEEPAYLQDLFITATRLGESPDKWTTTPVTRLPDGFWPISATTWHGQNLVAICYKTQFTLNMSNPMHPSVAGIKSLNAAVSIQAFDKRKRLTYPTNSDLSLDEILGGVDQTWGSNSYQANAKVLVEASAPVHLYQRAAQGAGSIDFDQASTYGGNPVEQMFMRRPLVLLNGNYLAVSTSQEIGSRVLLADISDPTRPRSIGHFGAPWDLGPALYVFPDGRVIMGFDKITVLGKPGQKN